MPAVIILALLTLVPSVFLYYVSITDYELGELWSTHRLVGFKNYHRLFSGRDFEFWPSVRISIKFMLLATTIETVLGFVIALLLNQEFRFKSIVFGCLMLPITITPSIVGQMWKLMYNAEYGVLNYFAQNIFGAKVAWLGPDLAFLSTLLVDVWQWTPFVALIIYAGLRSIPSEPFEAALVDGANNVQSFWYITLPLIRPLLMLAVIFRSMDSLKLFDVPFVLTQGGPGSATELLSLHVYRLGFAQTGWVARAAATAVVLLVMIITLSRVLVRHIREGSGTE